MTGSINPMPNPMTNPMTDPMTDPMTGTRDDAFLTTVSRFKQKWDPMTNPMTNPMTDPMQNMTSEVAKSKVKL